MQLRHIPRYTTTAAAAAAATTTTNNRHSAVTNTITQRAAGTHFGIAATTTTSLNATAASNNNITRHTAATRAHVDIDAASMSARSAQRRTTAVNNVCHKSITIQRHRDAAVAATRHGNA
jgi:hypothetical protein